MEANGSRVNVSEQRLQDALQIEREVGQHEHLKTRYMVLLMTAPVWGQTVMEASGALAGVISGGAVAAIGAAGYLATKMRAGA